MAVTNWGQLSLLSYNINLNELGVYTLSLAFITPMFQFSNLQLRLLFVSDRQKIHPFESYFSLRILTNIFSIVFILMLSLIVFNDTKNLFICFLLTMTYVADSFIDIFNAKQHSNDNLKLVSYSTILRGLSGITGLSIGVLVFDNLLIAITLAFIFKVVSLIFFDYGGFKKESNKIIIEINSHAKKLFIWSIPMGLSLVIASLNVNVAKYFINYKFGLEIQGIYSTLSYVVVIGNMFIGAIGNALMVKISDYYHSNMIQKLKISVNIFLIITFISGVLLFALSYFFSYPFTSLVFSTKISVYSQYLTWIMGASIFMYLNSAIGFALTSVGIIKKQIWLSSISFLINILLNYLFFSITGVEYITLIFGFSFLIQFLVGYLIFVFKINYLEKIK